MPDPFDAFPRVRLAHLPTPLERLPRLSETLGVEVQVKRDDATGLGLGGNKVRKLEFLLGEALRDGATTVVTVGGVQSNHARQTAAAAARLGLRCKLVLPRVVPRASVDYEQSGNVLLDRLFGAELHVVDDEAAAAREIARILEAAKRSGETIALYPPGGSTPTGSLGYASAALELDAQARDVGVRFERIYAAASTAGTVAGLACGFALADRDPALQAVCVAGDAAAARTAFVTLAEGCASLLGIDAPDAERVAFRSDQLGEGYGIPSDAAREAIALCAQHEGLLLDPVYTGKAMAALVADARAGMLRGPVLFWHTGGAPALFAYREELVGRAD